MLHEPPYASRHESDWGHEEQQGGRREAGTCADPKQTSFYRSVRPALFGSVFIYMQLSTIWERLGLADKLACYGHD